MIWYIICVVFGIGVVLFVGVFVFIGCGFGFVGDD